MFGEKNRMEGKMSTFKLMLVVVLLGSMVVFATPQSAQADWNQEIMAKMGSGQLKCYEARNYLANSYVWMLNDASIAALEVFVSRCAQAGDTGPGPVRVDPRPYRR